MARMVTTPLYGGTGFGSMYGGAGDDVYVVDASFDGVFETAADPGFDVVYSSASYAITGIADGVEWLVLTGTAWAGWGNALANVIIGNTANNQLSGDAGNDTLFGDAGDDALFGEDDDDVLDGGAGSDAMNGGLGNDLFIVTSIGDVVYEGILEGHDTVRSSINYVLGADVEELYLFGGVAKFGTGNLSDNVLSGSSAGNTLSGLAGNDSLDDDLGADTLYGGDGNDTLWGGNDNDALYGGLDDDTMYGGVGSDSIVGDLGADYANGSLGLDTMYGGIGDDTLYGGFDNDSIYGGDDNDTLLGDLGNDVVDGGAGDDYMEGYDDADTLLGGAGYDTMYGGWGDDSMVGGADADFMNGDDGNDTVDGGTGDDTVDGGFGDDLMIGGADNDDLRGGDDQDTLDGGMGADSLTGGSGDDVLIVDDIGDVVVEAAGEGIDTVRSSVDFSLGGANLNVENLTLTGTAYQASGNSIDNHITGNASNNDIDGFAGDDTIDGGAGSDTMAGGLGDDIFTVDSVNDVVREAIGAGDDTVYSSVTYGLSDNIEDLYLTGTANLNANGNLSDNLLIGNRGNNLLQGFAGNDALAGSGVPYSNGGTDTMIGGTGDDAYLTDGGDTIIELSGEGTDRVFSYVSYTLGDNLENLSMYNLAAITGIGNALNNVISGSNAANVLNGMTGSDTLLGNFGNDTYITDGGDTIFEYAGDGIDLVLSSASFSLAAAGEVENLTLTGSAAINATGNILDNVLTGNAAANSLDASDGNDTLIAAAGNDSLTGGAGADSLDGGAGIDTAVYILSATGVSVSLATGLGSGGDAAGDRLVRIENLTGSIYDDTLTGDTNANLLAGADGNDDLNGGAGADTMIGGLGSDDYFVDNVKDVVAENAGEGIDTVNSYLSYVLSSNIENLILYGNGNISGTGNTFDNVLGGSGGNNLLLGLAGDDTIDGDYGNDTVVGGAGADLLYGGTGIDLADYSASVAGVQVDLSTNSATGGDAQGDLLFNIENVTGTAGDDVLIGDGAANMLVGGAGNDQLYGDAGADTLVGGTGNDSYKIDNAGVVVTEKAGEGTDNVDASVSYVLGANIEDLYLNSGANINGTGNALNNAIYGSSGDNVLNGGTGADTLTGGAGNDAYVTDGGDTITEYNGVIGGYDTVQSSVSYVLGANLETLTLTGTAALNGTGNSDANVLFGNSANNILSGLAGDDGIYGGAGNDTIIGGSGADVMNGGAGIDWADYSASASGITVQLTGPSGSTGDAIGDTFTSIENLRGTAFDDRLTGDNSANLITGDAGNDILDGQGGADTLVGGAGNDLYFVGNTGVVVTELASGGSDMVHTYVNYTLVANVESLEMDGSAGNINGTGNALNNSIIGNNFDNVLNGTTGIDTLRGYDGNDTYITDGGDAIFENAGEGTDLVRSSATFVLGADIENLTLTGSSAINGTGNADANILTGNAGKNSLSGGDGADTLVGGAGTDALYGGADGFTDVFVFNAISDSAKGSGRDMIHDFTSGTDDIDLSLIDANTSLAGNQAFRFNTTTAAANSVWYAVNGTGLIVYGDTTGDRTADFEVGISLAGSIISIDFLL